MEPERIVSQALEKLDAGTCVLIPDYPLPVNRAGFQMSLAVRSSRSKRLTRTLSGFYRWLLDGDVRTSASRRSDLLPETR